MRENEQEKDIMNNQLLQMYQMIQEQVDLQFKEICHLKQDLLFNNNPLQLVEFLQGVIF